MFFFILFVILMEKNLTGFLLNMYYVDIMQLYRA